MATPHPSPTVLIVEDDYLQALLLKKVLISLNYTILGHAISGKSAIELAKKLRPDIITMDIMLSDHIDGIEAATEIQKNQDVDLIYISGNSCPNIMERASKTKYRFFIKKPYSVQDLKNLFLYKIDAA